MPEPDAEDQPASEPEVEILRPAQEPAVPELPLERRGGTAREYPPGDPNWKDRFLELLGEGFSVQGAAAVVGRSSRWCYQSRGRDADFADAWDKAKTRRISTLEESAWRRAVHGWEEPIYYQGQKVGSKRVYSTALTLVFLRAWIPDPYRAADMFTAGTTSIEETAARLRSALAEIDVAVSDPANLLGP